MKMQKQHDLLKYRHLGIYTHNENVVYMRNDCHICISEGFEALTRIRVATATVSLVASLHVVSSELLRDGEIALSETAARKLGISEGEMLEVSHLEPLESLSAVRAKIYNKKLGFNDFRDIITDIVAGDYSNIHLSAFITACAGERLDLTEITHLTKAMIASGKQLTWDREIVVDKHCIGGLPGNRTTPIVVAIVTAYGLTMPKTSSRAITSPAGTADTMEVITNVSLSNEEIRKVVQSEGGCMVWGGTAQLSPADDLLIKVEKALDIDSEGQLIASVLSKKAAAGSKYVIIDIPVGETAKVRSSEMARKLKRSLETIGSEVGLLVEVLITDGTQPVGRGIGPALEAQDVLSVLRNEPQAPKDLRERGLLLAGALLELAGNVTKGKGIETARNLLESGKAFEKFKSICKAQGRFTEPLQAPYAHDIKAAKEGLLTGIDNRKIAKLAKLAGAPQAQSAGVLLRAKLGDSIREGQPLYTLYAETEGALRYALEYQQRHTSLLTY